MTGVPVPTIGDGVDEKGSMNTGDMDLTTITSTVQDPPAPGPVANLKIKKVDHFYSKWSKKWKYTNSGSNIIPELRTQPAEGKDDPWQQYCFVVIREIPQNGDAQPYFKIAIKSPYLLKACKDVVGDIQGVSWNDIPLEASLDPKLLIAFLPEFKIYKEKLASKAKPTGEDRNIVATLDVFIDYFHTDYRATLARIQNLTSHGEITFDLLYAVLVPRSIVLSRNPLTGELQAFQLTSASLVKQVIGPSFYDVLLEGIDVDDSDTLNVSGFTRFQTRVVIRQFAGTEKIVGLDAYPMIFHPKHAQLKEKLVAKGKKWANIAGMIHHMYYEGTGGIKGPTGRMIKYNLNSRVMVDRGNFRKLNPNYSFPPKKISLPEPDEENFDNDFRSRQLLMIQRKQKQKQAQHNTSGIPQLVQGQEPAQLTSSELTEDDLLIASPIVYGFSLADKLWLEFDVEKLTDIEWNEDAFDNLVLPEDRKTLLKSLVECHNAELGFDDFIKGKGRGLVVNLFGPPGVGKTLTAEATSEHVKRPLYVVGAGDLGTTASQLDQELQRVFELATAWRAMILIDEADVFLEQRSLHDLERNAMVAVFLRHLEYYPAVLFLTTNRVKTFDEALLSRIHVALHFHGLTKEALKSVWTAFLAKAGVIIGSEGGVTDGQLDMLSTRNLNGRQVKNAVKTSTSLALSRGERIRYQHLAEVLAVMEKFENEFESMKV
ncbi:hypothetical protein M422DRAFT_241814 [Sphaerobolus stellatus SS14]|nr:hypothetical protein M422DRAFT_241814 [Sphaerobolus stellatus SS14]